MRADIHSIELLPLPEPYDVSLTIDRKVVPLSPNVKVRSKLKQCFSYLQKNSWVILRTTLEFGIDVGQEIIVGPGNFGKNNNCRALKFDWHDLSPIFLNIMLLHDLKVFQKPIKHHFLVIKWYNRADQILKYNPQMLI